MEQLLHYTWKHKLFPLTSLLTTTGKRVEVVDPGLSNRNAGPDFFNAKVKIDGTLWVGNVEIHLRSSDWYSHGHEKDAHYNNVVLHVVKSADTDVYTQDGKLLPQLVLAIPTHVEQQYRQLLATDQYPPCYRIIPSLSKLTIHAWMSALQTERLERKTQDINRRVKLCDGSWEAAYFVTLARNYGFGINGDAFEAWAKSIPLHAVDHHRDDLFQIEAIFLGQAGLLDVNAVPEKYQQQAMNEGYFTKLRNEYQYLAHKFSLTPIDAHLWRFLRLRPQNFPHIRIAQLANLYYQRKAGLSALLACKTVKEAQDLLKTQVTPYWETHHAFGSNNPQPSILQISAKQGTNIDRLEKTIFESANIPELSEQDIIVTSVRQYHSLLSAQENLSRVLSSLESGLSGDLVSEDLRLVLDDLANITGQNRILADEVLRNIFTHFCVGK
jgi:hypothetical protein